MKRFDRKFGADLIGRLSTGPAIYLFKDGEDKVLYVGKAKNVRQRLSRYRNASRRKADRKMRAIVREATSLEVRAQPSEVDALAVENELIRELQPPFNVEGKYSFLYPAIGVRRTKRHTLLCFTTDVDAWSDRELRWFGTYRSRRRARSAFDALVELLALLGHLERASTLGDRPDVKGSRIVGVRQLPGELVAATETFLSGRSASGLSTLTAALVEKPQARRDASHVQQLIYLLDDFYRSDLQPLHLALTRAGHDGTFVPQDERDTLFIRTRE